MDALIIEGTANTPSIELDAKNETFEISGESRPEHVQSFFSPVLEWFNQYDSYLHFVFDSYGDTYDNKTIQFNFKLEYFNSSSAKYFMDIMLQLKALNEKYAKLNIEICWHYDEPDEDMQEAGEEFEDMTGIPFTYISVPV